jgi:hypothetical protein
VSNWFWIFGKMGGGSERFLKPSQLKPSNHLKINDFVGRGIQMTKKIYQMTKK